ncbi:MAG: metallophosphoesterase [Desulfarculus sp.]|nr:metallophosphoesterase [Pseudomonadota bacterium]MBU4599256.1 metallophosphoesterase [Pseudomonadota bacterium]MBV1715476.1 metallophosphoesterase [Desulfarculus sp.]MBV1739677.1 metallophosphoesterase [Desulfarculus sp.]MBV1750714.1 metallophosphoesterase [Desulfarculus sp.]
MARFDAVIMGDLHAHNYRRMAVVGPDGRTDRLGHCISALDQFVSYSRENDAWRCFVGDLIHERGRVDTLVLNSVSRSMAYDGQVDLFLAGNHDQVSQSDKGTESCLSGVLGAANSPVEGRIVVEVPQVVSIGVPDIGSIAFGCLPYRRKPDLLRQGIADIEADPAWVNADFKIFLGHCGLAEEAKRLKIAEECISAGAVPSDAALAVFGHYHEPADVTDRVVMVGAPMMHTFGDLEPDRGFIHLTIEGGELTWKRVPITTTPKWFTVRGLADIGPHLAGAYVRVIGKTKAGLARTLAATEETAPMAVNSLVKPDPKKDDTRLGLNLASTAEVSLATYIGAFPPKSPLTTEAIMQAATTLGA